MGLDYGSIERERARHMRYLDMWTRIEIELVVAENVDEQRCDPERTRHTWARAPVVGQVYRFVRSDTDLRTLRFAWTKMSIRTSQWRAARAAFASRATGICGNR